LYYIYVITIWKGCGIMASMLEDRLLSYIQDNANDGRLIIKIEDLCGALSETRGPVHRAVNSLAKRKKIKSQSRSRKGLEITLMNKSNNNESPESPSLLSDTEIEPKSVSFYDITAHISFLNIQQLQILKDLVELNIIKKKGDDSND